MIHQYQLNGYHIVLDVPSGSVHVVDPAAYEMIVMYRDHSREEIAAAMAQKHPDLSAAEVEECFGDIAALERAGKLFSPEEAPPGLSGRPAGEPVVKALCLHVAHTCNLNCGYCFASQGKYSGDRGLMSFQVGRQALDFLVANSGGRRNLEVDFFGGEPLMNWEVVKALVAYARGLEAREDKRFRFTLTTNGMLLDGEVMDFANREMDNVVLSLDGRRQVHDRLRRDYGDRGSYDVIVPRFQEFVRRRGEKSYYIRGTFTHYNTDFASDVLHMADLGFTQLSMEPVVCAPGEPYALTAQDLPVLKREYERLAAEMLRREREGRGFTFYHYMIDLAHGPCIYKRISGCGSGSEYLAVTPWGDLYPCHQFVGEEKFRVGSVWEGVTNLPLREEFAGCNLYARPQCRDCWARLYCSGGCAANAYHAAGRIQGVYEYGCELFRKRMECAIMLQAARAVDSAGADRL